MGLFSLFCVRTLWWTAKEDLTFRIEMPRRPAEIAPRFRAAEPLVIQVDPGRARRELGWAPRQGLEVFLDDMISKLSAMGPTIEVAGAGF